MKWKVLLLLFVLPKMAVAEPPWAIDDTGTTEDNTGTFYLNYTLNEAKNRARTENIPNLAGTFGIGPTTELGIALPVVRYKDPEKRSAITGVGDASTAIKHRFLETEAGFSMTGSSQVSFPTGNGDWGTGQGGFGLFLSLIAQQESGAWKATGQVAASRLMKKGEPVSWLYGSTLSRAFGDAFLGMQAYANVTRQPDGYSHELIAGFGCGFHLSPNLAAQLQWSPGFGHQTNLTAYAGLTMNFPLAPLSK